MSSSRAASGLASIRFADHHGMRSGGQNERVRSPMVRGVRLTLAPRGCADRSDEPLAYQNNLTRTGTVWRLGCHP